MFLLVAIAKRKSLMGQQHGNASSQAFKHDLDAFNPPLARRNCCVRLSCDAHLEIFWLLASGAAVTGYGCADRPAGRRKGGGVAATRVLSVPDHLQVQVANTICTEGTPQPQPRRAALAV